MPAYLAQYAPLLRQRLAGTASNVLVVEGCVPG